MFRMASLRYAYAGQATLAFPDIDVPQGAVVLLRGNSGSGKSTWLALAAALLRPTSGDITVAGQDLLALRGAKADQWRAQHLGFLPQRLHLSGALSVADNLALRYFAAGQPRDDAAIDRALAALGVADLCQRLPSQLSGGQAQRVALARALLMQPKVILADEPTASLDDAAARAALDLLVDGARTSLATLVIATHDARVALALPQARCLHLTDRGAPA